MDKRDLGQATMEVQRINLPGSRGKSCCDAVCLNGDIELQEKVRYEVTAQFLTFGGLVSPGPQAESTGPAGGGSSAPSPSPAPVGAAEGGAEADGGAAGATTAPCPCGAAGQPWQG